MKADIVVEGLNRCLEDLRLFREIDSKGHFVLRREVNIPTSFTKSIKEFVVNLYFVRDRKSYLIINKSFTGKSTTEEEEEKCHREVDIQLCQAIFFLMSQSVVMDIMVEGRHDELAEIWHQL